MRIGFWDLETTGLEADRDQLLCGVVGAYQTNDPCTPDLVEFKLESFAAPALRCNDRGLALAIRDCLETFDLVIGYNSILFDQRFLNTRLALYGKRAVQIARHKDLLYVMRSKFRLQSNSLANVARFLFGSTIKTTLDKTGWRLALAGDEREYATIVHHCRLDVIELARVWNRVKDVSGILR